MYFHSWRSGLLSMTMILLYVFNLPTVRSFASVRPLTTITTSPSIGGGGSRYPLLRQRPWMMSTNTEETTSSTPSSTTTTMPATSSSEKGSQPRTRVRRVLSGVQPTGSLHLGNYLGAIKQWVEFQNKHHQEQQTTIQQEEGEQLVRTEQFFCVVDMHAITLPHDPAALSESTLSSAALYLAAGIDPQKSKIFVQSHVPAHAELTWLLNCMTPMNWLERMIQFKEKSRKSGTESVGAGLFTYPVLMTADILLYQAADVPVGEDQRQHLELARDISRRFHDLYCKGNAFKKRCKQAGIPSRPTFTEPNAMIVETGISRIMSLTDGTSKMSKSDPNDASRINILDPPDVIRQKIKRCKTDSLPGIEWDNPERPEATNLLNIYRAVTGESREAILERFESSTWGQFKPALADAIIAHLEPIQNRYHEIRRDQTYLDGILREGANAANAVANQTLHAAKVAMGFVPPPPSLPVDTLSPSSE